METVKRCPNEKCSVTSLDDSKFYIKKGYYKTKHNHQPVPRYKCKHCGQNFSSHTNRETVGQHKPHLNERVFELISSGVTLRRTAIILKTTKKTVESKFQFISKLAEEAHKKFLQNTTRSEE